MQACILLFVASALVGQETHSVLLAPEEFCFLTASPVEKVTGALMLLSVGMFGPQDRTNNVRNTKVTINMLLVGGGDPTP